MIAVGHGIGYWVARKVRGHYDADASQAIGMLKDGEPVAGVIYENMNGASVTCHIAIEDRITPKFVATIFDYPFKQLGVGKIVVTIGEANEESIGLVRNMGFCEEARIKDAHPDGDMLIFTMTPEQCRFIGGKYGRKVTN